MEECIIGKTKCEFWSKRCVIWRIKTKSSSNFRLTPIFFLLFTWRFDGKFIHLRHRKRYSPLARRKAEKCERCKARAQKAFRCDLLKFNDRPTHQRMGGVFCHVYFFSYLCSRKALIGYRLYVLNTPPSRICGGGFVLPQNRRQTKQKYTSNKLFFNFLHFLFGHFKLSPYLCTVQKQLTIL